MDRRAQGPTKSRGKNRMRGNIHLLIFFLFLTSLPLYSPKSLEASPKSDEPEILERVIKIKGKVEKPRVIFIVPRANLWKNDIFKKSFFQDILKPVYPEALIKDLGSFKQH